MLILLVSYAFIGSSQMSVQEQMKVDSLKEVVALGENDTVIINALSAWDNIIYSYDPELDLLLNMKIDSIATKNLNEKLNAKEKNKFINSKVFALNNIGVYFEMYEDYDSALYYYKQSLSFALENEQKESIARSLSNIGAIYEVEYNYALAVQYYKDAIEVYKEIGEKNHQAAMLLNAGVIFEIQGDHSTAIDYYMNSLVLYDQSGNKYGMAAAQNNIAILYEFQGDLEKALEYYEKSLSLRREIEDLAGVAKSLNNIGAIYRKLGDHKQAISLYNESLEIKQELNDKKGIAHTLKNIGFIYHSQEDYSSAIDFYMQSLTMRKEIGDQEGICSSYISLGEVYMTQGLYSKALICGDSALNIGLNIGAAVEISAAAKLLWQVNKYLYQYDESLSMFELYVEYQDSVLSEENQKAIIQQQFKYEYGKKAAADSIKALEEAKVQDALLAAEKAETEKQKAQVKQQEQQKYYLFGGLALALLFGGFIFNRFRVASKQKNIIEEQKVVVEQQKAAVEEQKVELEYTHQQLEEHHKEIADSIMYAKRIQEAIMPSMSAMGAALKDGFVLYLPKDVVAGDFFWMESLTDALGSEGEVVYFAAADCTGHGVPGAMVSVVCSNALNKALLEEGIRDTGKLLDRTREIVIDRLAKSGGEVKDGMDISLCALNRTTRELKWSGANNPLWILRKGALEFEEIKANKQPIGLYHDPQPFATHQINLNEGDSIYVFTDGYQDQFGGPKGKKFKAKQLKELIIQNQYLSMDEQLKQLKSKFIEWKGEVEQIDDVCVIGVRV
ncbi:tetratricopeptide repeat protein [Parvicella tangerina]|nr:tetratricopeptide repeat protein [Parvicella tangerina]